MLMHGLQGFHGKAFLVPKKDALKPNLAFLEARYAVFREAL